MDKSKNRTDLLAAGRKKLQQFRKKKDHKGGGGAAKSSSKHGKPGAEDEDEPVAHHPAAADTEEPSEAHRQGLERCNGGSGENSSGAALPAAEGRTAAAANVDTVVPIAGLDVRPEERGEIVTSSHVMLENGRDKSNVYSEPSIDRMVEDFSAALPSSEVASDPNMEGEAEETTSTEVGFMPADSRDSEYVRTESSDSGVNEETAAATSPVPVEETQHAGVSDSDKPEEIVSRDQHLEAILKEEMDTASSRSDLEVGFTMAENRDKENAGSGKSEASASGLNEVTAAAALSPQFGSSQHGNTSSIPVEEVQEAGVNGFNKREENVSHDEHLEVILKEEGETASSRSDLEMDFSMAENRDRENVGSESSEVGTSWLNEETTAALNPPLGNASSISVEEIQEAGEKSSDKSKENVSNDEHLEVGLLLAENRDRDNARSENSQVVSSRLNEENAVSVSLQFVSAQHGNALSIPVEEIQGGGVNDPDKSVENVSHTNLEVGFPVAEDRDSEDVGSENSEVGTSGLNEETAAALSPRFGTAQHGNVLSIPVENMRGTGMTGYDKPEENVSHNEHLKMPSSTHDSFVAKGEYNSHTDDAEEGGGTDEGGSQQPSVGEVVVFDSDPVRRFPEGGPLSFEVEKVKEEDPLPQVDICFAYRYDSIERHLYLTNVIKDSLQLQLDEAIESNADSHQHYSDEVSKLWGLLKEAHESKGTVSEELLQCRSELRAVTLEKEKLENQCSLMKGEINQLNSGASELQSKVDHSQEELSQVSAELASCTSLLEVLQKQDMDSAARLVSEADARNMLVEENTKLASELLEQKDRLLILLNKQMQLENNLRETGACFDELAIENLYLSSSLVVHETKIKEMYDCRTEMPFQGLEEVSQSNNAIMEGAITDTAVDSSHRRYDDRDIDIAPGTAENSVALQKDEGLISSSSDALGVLKGRFEEVNNALDSLEKSIERMHAHSVSLSRSSGKPTSPGISKLIQAFELKTHHVDDVPEVVPPDEGIWSENPYISVSKEVCSLKDILKQTELDIGMVESHLKGEYNTRNLSEQLEKECEAQKQQNNILQVKINDLVEKLSVYKSKTDDLQNHLNEIQQNSNHQSETLLSQVDLLQKEITDKASSVNQEKESITSVVMKAIEKLDASTGLLVSENVHTSPLLLASVDAATSAIKGLQEKLEASHLNYNSLSASCEELNRLCTDVQGRKDLAVGRLNKYYRSISELVNDSWQSAGEAEIAVNSEEVSPENFEKLIEHLQLLMDERPRLLSRNGKLESELSISNQETEELAMRCKNLDNKVEDLCHANDSLELVLTNKNYNIEEFNRRCLALTKKLEEHSWGEDIETVPMSAEDIAVVKCDNTENDLYKSLLFRLEASVALLLQKHEGAIKQIDLSKNYLREGCKLPGISAEGWSLPLPSLIRQEFVPQVIELQEKLLLLSNSNLQLENEMHILREALSKTEEALEVARSELHSKVSDLEQSEQRLASVREKLSIAVAKGKGLIVQRDSLKQSLMEKSNELEKCSQELMSKEALLHEVEAKLKSCSEVERVEALESELSYIRNSATALRDSFLLKDSVLQRIEEVLEDLELPEHFHSKDIIEKIELLARSVAGNTSFTTIDWDQKSSMGASHSDAGCATTDTWKDELPSSSNLEFDELKRKYDELQRKLYGLAEHNDMLEQSLVERNKLVQKWEEVLNGIDTPSQLRSLEPEDRIEWLKRALAEVEQERDTLHLKIENLEVSSDMLIVDLEESHKKISELSAEVVAVKSEKEFFSESLDKLRYEYLGLSEKAIQDEIDNDNLRRELADLQEKMVKNFESKYHDIEKEMWRLHGLVIKGLPDNDNFDTLCSLSGAERLEGLLKNLIDSYTTLHLEKSTHKDSEKECVPEESNLSHDETVAVAISDDKEQELAALKLELDEAYRNMDLVKEERNRATEQCHSLMLEIEAISNQRNLLQEEWTKDVEKYQTLELEIEAIIKQRDTFQEQLAQEKLNSVAVEKCESLMLEIEATRNQKNLLQVERAKDMEKYQTLVLELEATMKQRDALQEQVTQEAQKSASAREQRDAFQEQLAQAKQNSVAVEKYESLMLEIEATRNQKNLLQEERVKYVEKYQTLVLELEATMKQRDALQEQLTQEAQKSASTREKLNVAVRKGKGLVQQRDNLKQAIEEMNTSLEQLKIEQSKRVEALESEKSLLANQFAETEHSLQDNNQNMSRVLTALNAIDVGSEVNIVDPVQKIEVIGKLCHELRSAIVSSQDEAKKSKRAAELLLAELTEVQERSDTLQEELTVALADKSDALSRHEQFIKIHSEEKKKQIDTLLGLKSGIYQLKNGCFEFSNLLSNVFIKDMDIFCYLEAFMESMSKQMDGANAAELPVLASSDLLSNFPMKEGRFPTSENDSVLNVHEQFVESSIMDLLALVSTSLCECITENDDAKENIHKHSFSVDQQASKLLGSMQTVQRKLASQKEYSESLKRDVAGLELIIKEKETEVCTMQRNVTLLYEACSCSVAEIENKRVGNSLPPCPGDHLFEKSGVTYKLPSYIDGQDSTDGHNFSLTEDRVRMVADSLLSTVKGSSYISDISESHQRELKATIADLQRELQEKGIQMNTISAELVSQIREAETSANKSLADLDSARSQVLSLEKQVEALENDRKLLQLRVDELKGWEASSMELQEKIKSLSDALSVKDQEIEALMQALDEEESQMEGLESRNKQLENIVQEKNLTIETIEASRSKAVSKLSTTVSKFDELHNLSESLLAEVEKLQSQLQGRDSEISFLRQEVTRCTNDILTSQEIKNYSFDIHELLNWMDMMVSRCGVPRVDLSGEEGSQIREYTDILGKKIGSIINELDGLRKKAESREALLQIERGRVEELSCKTEVLESSLREKETQIELFEGRTDSGQQASINSPGPLEIEQVVQRDSVTLGPIKTHVRSGRKVNNDHIAIAVDTEKYENIIEDEDDDKSHGFKSLTMSKIVPRVSRPIADRIDGIWVSGERLLMRQPTLRLGLIIYWVALHILLASVI